MNRQRKLAEEPRAEEIKNINRNLATELEAYKRQETLMTQTKDEVSRERASLMEQNVSGKERERGFFCRPLATLFTSLLLHVLSPE